MQAVISEAQLMGRSWVFSISLSLLVGCSRALGGGIRMWWDALSVIWENNGFCEAVVPLTSSLEEEPYRSANHLLTCC